MLIGATLHSRPTKPSEVPGVHQARSDKIGAIAEKAGQLFTSGLAILLKNSLGIVRH